MATKDTPLVSILMPYYEQADYICASVESVKKQTYENWELIVVDDCSPGSPASEALGYSSSDKIKVIRNPENIGLPRTRNRAAEDARGKLFLPLDGDDEIAPTYLEKTVSALLSQGVDAAYTDIQLFGKETGVRRPKPDLVSLLAGHYPCNTFLYKREVFESNCGYDPDLFMAEDKDFWLSTVKKGFRFAHVPEPLYRYRRHEGSLTAKPLNNFAELQRKMTLKHKDVYAEHLPELLVQWTQNSLTGVYSYESLEKNYLHLESEFHKLLEQYQNLESICEVQQARLGSVKSLAKHLVYNVARRAGIVRSRI